jgi:hypothetical protein
MKSRKLAIGFVGSLVFLFGFTVAAWAGGGAGGVYACCVVDNPGGGAIALDGTISVVWSPSPSPYVDVKLRLERGGKFAFFQLHLDEPQIALLDNFEFTCAVLNPNEPSHLNLASAGAVQILVDQILTAFFPGTGFDHTNTKLVITRKSITFTDGNAGGPIDGTGRVAAMGDVNLYVVSPAAANYESNPNCPVPR